MFELKSVEKLNEPGWKSVFEKNWMNFEENRFFRFHQGIEFSKWSKWSKFWIGQVIEAEWIEWEIDFQIDEKYEFSNGAMTLY